MMRADLVAKQLIYTQLQQHFDQHSLRLQHSCCDTLTLWVSESDLKPFLLHLRDGPLRYHMLFDLYALDERLRQHWDGQPTCDFSLVYQLMSVRQTCDIKLKVALWGDYPSTETITDLWPNANWYEREIWDMFGIKFVNHPLLKRILTPPTFNGHPLRKEYACRATEQPPFQLDA